MSTYNYPTQNPWLSVDDNGDLQGDGHLSNTAGVNKGRNSRQTSYKVRRGNGDMERTVTVNQAGKDLYVVFDHATPWDVGSSSGTVIVTGKTNAQTLAFAITDSNGMITTLPTTFSIDGGTTYDQSLSGATFSGDPGATGEIAFQISVPVGAYSDAGERTCSIVATASATGVSDATATMVLKQSNTAYLDLSVGELGEHLSSVSINFDWDGNPSSGSDDDVYVWSNLSLWEIAAAT